MFVGILCSRRASKFAKFLTLLARHDYQPTWFDHNHAILPIVEHGGVVPGGGGRYSLYGLYRYVPRDRAWFLMFLRSDRSFVPVGIVFPM